MSEKTTDLVARAKQGDSAAFEALYIEYKDRLAKFVMKKGLPEQDAEDIVSETFVEVMKHIQDLDNNEFFGTWIHRIALNKANLFYNRQNRMQRASFDTADSLDSGLDKIDGEAAAIEQAYEDEYGDTVLLPSDYAENEDTKRIIAEQISSLTDDQKEALVLFYYENRSLNEIAEMTGTNVNNVKGRLFKARKSLKKKLEVLQEQGIVLCAVPISSIVPALKGGVIGVMGAAGSATATSAAAGSVSATSAAAGSVSATSAAAGSVSASSAAAGSVAASSSVASSSVAGAANAAVGAAEAGAATSAVGGAGAAAGASAAVGLKIAAVAIAATVAVGAAVAGIVIHNRDKGTEIDAEVRDASESEESEEETEPAVPAAASEAESEAEPEPEKKPYVLLLDGEEIEIDFNTKDNYEYTAWGTEWDENHDCISGYILLKDIAPEYTGRWLLAEFKEPRVMTPVESAEPTESGDRYCTIDDSYFPPDYDASYSFCRFFDAGKALFVRRDHWIAVFPEEGRIDIHPMTIDEPEENWYYGLPINDEGDLYDGTYVPPFRDKRVNNTTFSKPVVCDGPYSIMESNGLLMPDNQEMEKQPDIDPETLRPIVDTSSLEKPKMDESWKQPYIQTIKNCVPDDFAGSAANMDITFLWLEGETMPICQFTLSEYPDASEFPNAPRIYPEIKYNGIMAIRDNAVSLLPVEGFSFGIGNGGNIYDGHIYYREGSEIIMGYEHMVGYAARWCYYISLSDNGLSYREDLEWPGTMDGDPKFKEGQSHDWVRTIGCDTVVAHSLEEMEEAIMNYEFTPEEAEQ